MKRISTIGVVLKSFNHRDSDKIYTLFTRDLGKISVWARGVRKISSRRAGNLDTLNLVKVSLSEDASGRKYVQEASSVNSFSKIKKDLGTMSRGVYVAELIHRTTEEGAGSERIYELLAKFLKVSSKFPGQVEVCVRYFELNFLELMGYGVSFWGCGKCKKTPGETGAEFYLNKGSDGFSCASCRGSGLKFSSETLQSAKKLSEGKLHNVGPAVLKELEKLTTALIDDHFGIRIKSRELQ